MGRSPCCSKVGLKRGTWSSKEDALLTNYILQHGEGQWRSLPKKAGLLRCGKSCRLRWMNYLRPGVKRGNITPDEEDLIIRLHSLLGNRWSLIARRLPGRTDNELKNYWYTRLLKKLKTAPKEHNDLSKLQSKTSAVLPEANGEHKIHGINEENTNDSKTEEQAAPKTRVYLPKPIKPSSVFSRNSNDSVDGSFSGSSSSECVVGKYARLAGTASYVDWPLFELHDANYGVCGETQELEIFGEFDMSLPYSELESCKNA